MKKDPYDNIPHNEPSRQPVHLQQMLSNMIEKHFRNNRGHRIPNLNPRPLRSEFMFQRESL